jgi:hypothetical protein
MRHISNVSTIAEIQEAIEKLPPQEKEALSTWLSHEETPMPTDQEAALLASLERAEHQLDSGQGVPLDKARDLVRKWASK